VKILIAKLKHAAYVIEDSWKMANKSGRNMLEDSLMIKRV